MAPIWKRKQRDIMSNQSTSSRGWRYGSFSETAGSSDGDAWSVTVGSGNETVDSAMYAEGAAGGCMDFCSIRDDEEEDIRHYRLPMTSSREDTDSHSDYYDDDESASITLEDDDTADDAGIAKSKGCLAMLFDSDTEDEDDDFVEELERVPTLSEASLSSPSSVSKGSKGSLWTRMRNQKDSESIETSKSALALGPASSTAALASFTQVSTTDSKISENNKEKDEQEEPEKRSRWRSISPTQRSLKDSESRSVKSAKDSQARSVKSQGSTVQSQEYYSSASVAPSVAASQAPSVSPSVHSKATASQGSKKKRGKKRNRFRFWKRKKNKDPNGEETQSMLEEREPQDTQARDSMGMGLALGAATAAGLAAIAGLPDSRAAEEEEDDMQTVKKNAKPPTSQKLNKAITVFEAEDVAMEKPDFSYLESRNYVPSWSLRKQMEDYDGKDGEYSDWSNGSPAPYQPTNYSPPPEYGENMMQAQQFGQLSQQPSHLSDRPSLQSESNTTTTTTSGPFVSRWNAAAAAAPPRKETSSPMTVSQRGRATTTPTRPPLKPGRRRFKYDDASYGSEDGHSFTSGWFSLGSLDA